MVKGRKPAIIWNKQAAASFQKFYEYIRADSVDNAEKVKTGIIRVIERLPANPERYPPDKLKKNNSGNYRAFEKFSMRVAYKFTKGEIIILRVRHVKQEPKLY